MHGPQKTSSKKGGKIQRLSVQELCPLPFILHGQETTAVRFKYWSRICTLNSDQKQQVLASLSACCMSSAPSDLYDGETQRFPTAPSGPQRLAEVSGDMAGPTRQPLTLHRVRGQPDPPSAAQRLTDLSRREWMTVELQGLRAAAVCGCVALHKSCVSAKLNHVM